MIGVEFYLFAGLVGALVTGLAWYGYTCYSDLTAERENLSATIENLAEGVYRSSMDGKQLSANRALVQLNGYDTESELLGAVKDIAVEWYVDPTRRAEFSRLLRENGKVTDFVSEIYRHKTRERIWVSENARLVRHPRTGKPLHYEGTVRDITDTVVRSQSDKLLKNLTDKLPHGLFQLVRLPDKTYTCTYVSQRFREMVNLAEDESFDGAVFASHVHPDDQQEYSESLKRSRIEMVDWFCQFRFVGPDGSVEWCKIVATPEKNSSGMTIWHGYLSNISARKAAEEKVHQLAYFDPLTGLANRTLFVERTTSILAKASAESTEFAIGFIDLDNFKSLNDTYGHGFGDKLLKQVAGRLSDTLPDGALLSRFGGDEFVFLVRTARSPSAEENREVHSICNRLLDAVQNGIVIDNMDCPMTLSLGVSQFEASQNTCVDDLLKSADIAMYEAKRSGRNNYVLHDADMVERVASKYKLQRDLQMDIRAGRFEIELQPQVNQSGRIVAAETLVRWNHPELGRIMPSEFIGLAEQIGQIGTLNNWVLNEGIKLLQAWRHDPALDSMSLSINISPTQMLDPKFVNRVREQLTEAGLPNGLLMLELTEHAMARNPEQVRENMLELKRAGVRFSLDDFGTGYSSISQLRNFPFDELKVDGSFVSDIANVEETRSLVLAIINMAKALELKTVAEHVSEPEQHEILSQMGCDIFQGFLFSRPLPTRDFETLARAQSGQTREMTGATTAITA